jgi:nucleoside 2-deoxyribosyltransferase
MTKRKLYLAGSMLNKSAQYLRAEERDAIAELDKFNIFNPMDNKEINDKSKNPTAEKIFAMDTGAILESEVIVADIAQTIGTSVEMGQIAGYNYFIDRLHEIVRNAKEEECVDDFNLMVANGVHRLLKEVPRKTVYWKSEDVRDTNIQESGYRRSHSYNQYLIGCLLEISGEPQTFDEILEKLKED